MLGGAEVVLETIGVETEIDKYRMGLVYRHDLESLAVELQIRLGKDLLEGLDERPESATLDCFDFE